MKKKNFIQEITYQYALLRRELILGDPSNQNKAWEYAERYHESGMGPTAKGYDHWFKGKTKKYDDMIARLEGIENDKMAYDEIYNSTPNNLDDALQKLNNASEANDMEEKSFDNKKKFANKILSNESERDI